MKRWRTKPRDADLRDFLAAEIEKYLDERPMKHVEAKRFFGVGGLAKRAALLVFPVQK